MCATSAAGPGAARRHESRSIDLPLSYVCAQVNILESVLFAFGIAATLILMVKIQHIGVQNNSSQFELEHILLVVTQSGVFLYSMFQVKIIYMACKNKNIITRGEAEIC